MEESRLTSGEYPPPTHDLADLVVAVLSKKTSCGQAARAAGVTEAEMTQWTRRFLDAAAMGLGPGGPPGDTTDRSMDLEASNEALREQLREQLAQLDHWRSLAGEVLVPSATLR